MNLSCSFFTTALFRSFTSSWFNLCGIVGYTWLGPMTNFDMAGLRGIDYRRIIFLVWIISCLVSSVWTYQRISVSTCVRIQEPLCQGISDVYSVFRSPLPSRSLLMTTLTLKLSTPEMYPGRPKLSSQKDFPLPEVPTRTPPRCNPQYCLVRRDGIPVVVSWWIADSSKILWSIGIRVSNIGRLSSNLPILVKLASTPFLGVAPNQSNSHPNRNKFAERKSRP